VSARVVITGAAGGIGAAAKTALERRGARVVGLDLEAGPGIFACDVRDQASVDRAVAAAVDQLGGLDVLVNNAGVGLPQSAGTAPGEDAEAVIDINLMGPWRVTAAALPALRAARGRVINVASGLAHLTVPFATAYCMSKRGLVAYSDALRIEHGDALTVTTVYPGYIRTPIHEASQDQGVPLEGIVPAETVEDAARTITRAALGRPVRDLGTTRRGDLSYRALRLAPRALVDRGIRGQLARAVKRGTFGGDGLAAEFAERNQAAKTL
jgi:NAD(P)-dependent dehydrogenase (short-subunit alcohol dehydrogenase family)